MLYFGLFFAELLFLFLLSQTLTRNISYITHATTKSKTITIYVLAVLFLPGTVIHELAHFFMAKLLFVHAGNIRLLPQLEEKDVKLGTVSIAKTDPIRRFFIGAAPFLFGTSIILATLYALVKFNLLENVWYLLLAGYIVFEISNTMYSSKKDMEGALELLIILLIIIGVGYFLGVRLSLSHDAMQFATTVFQKGSLFLAVPIAIDFILIALLLIFKKLLR